MNRGSKRKNREAKKKQDHYFKRWNHIRSSIKVLLFAGVIAFYLFIAGLILEPMVQTWLSTP